MKRALIAVALIAGCAPATTAPPTPEQLALSAFSLEPEPAPESLATLFGVEADDRRLPDLLDALDRLPDGSALSVVDSRESNGGWWIDLETDGAAGEQQSWVVQLEPVQNEAAEADSAELEPAAAGWRIVWLSGPDASWPRRTQPRRYTGLSVSASPDGE